MRQAKVITMYSNIEDEISTTVPTFVKERGLTKSQTNKLYTTSGWIDDEGIHWRVNAAPEITKSIATSAQKFMYELLKERNEDVAVRCYESNLIFLPSTSNPEAPTVAPRASKEQQIQYYANKHNCSCEEAEARWFK